MKAGIVADNYKVERFKKELSDEGFTFGVHPGKSVTTITVECQHTDLSKINKICKKVELHFKHSN